MVGFLIFTIIFDFALPFMIIYAIVKGVSKSKKNKSLTHAEQEKEKNEDEEQKVEEHPQLSPKEHVDYCDYCGAIIPSGKRKCPSCGAKINLK